MTAAEKYVEMNNQFCKLRDAIYNPNVEEADEDPQWNPQIQTALYVIMQYLDYYKVNNKVKSRVKGETPQIHLVKK
jgi:hypothetical protein